MDFFVVRPGMGRAILTCRKSLLSVLVGLLSCFYEQHKQKYYFGAMFPVVVDIGAVDLGKEREMSQKVQNQQHHVPCRRVRRRVRRRSHS